MKSLEDMVQKALGFAPDRLYIEDKMNDTYALTAFYRNKADVKHRVDMIVKVVKIQDVVATDFVDEEVEKSVISQLKSVRA